MLKNLIMGDDTDKLPERVRLAIRDQQDRSELLITWFQLAVLIVIGSLLLAVAQDLLRDSSSSRCPGCWRSTSCSP